MKNIAGIYDPYMDTLGGGERYCLTVAEILLNAGYQVDLFWSGDRDIITKAETRFNLKLSSLNLVKDIFRFVPNKIECVGDKEKVTKAHQHEYERSTIINKLSNFIRKYTITRKYKVLFYLSDWSVPFIFSHNNLLHVQVPFHMSKQSFVQKILTRLKARLVNQVICNSKFTNKFALSQIGEKCVVVYPPVDIEKFSPNEPKENIILTVGRFDNILNSKNQDILIELFKTLSQHNRSWKFILAGGSLESPASNSFLQHLRSISEGYPIEFVVNPKFSELKAIYEKSKIYWHAAGFGIDQIAHPENTEHFGMAPVEAMASGLVPVVVNKGGLGEIIQDHECGLLWDTDKDLLSYTQNLIDSPDLLKSMSNSAVTRSKQFSKESFISHINPFLFK
jgi:glycosyltransferase involved in cell wall biosynthesis